MKKHKVKPPQFESVAGGIHKRLENDSNRRKSNRLSGFDSSRNLTECESPVPRPVKSKEELRREQLKQWKAEKEKRQKEEAKKKKKPFLIGAPQLLSTFFPPPPLPNQVAPSSPGLVTRSRAAQNTKQTETKEKEANARSFAPPNASFHTPAMKSIPKPPDFGAPKAKKDSKLILGIRFEPLVKEVKQTRSKTKQNTVETRETRKLVNANNKVTKQVKPANSIQSSSTSEFKSLPKQNVVKTKTTCKPINNKSKPTQPNIPMQVYSKQSSSSSNLQDSKPSSKPRNIPIMKNRKPLKPSIPKNSIPKSESSSEERLQSPKSSEDVPMNLEVTVSQGKDLLDASDLDKIENFLTQLTFEITRITKECDTWERIFVQTVLPEAVQEHVLGAVGQARLLMSQELTQFTSLIERCARPEPGTSLVTLADLQVSWDLMYMQVENVDIRFKKLEEMRSRSWQEEPAVKPKIVKPAGERSRLKEMIAAARKAKKEEAAPPPVNEPEKTFEAEFFQVSSPVRSPAPSTPSRNPSLLKAVLSNEAKNSASKVTLKPQIVLGTPGRSILKNSTKKSAKKSAKFNELEKSATVTEIGAPSKVAQKGTYTQRSLHCQDSRDELQPMGVMTRRMRKTMMDKDKPRTPRIILAEIEKNVVANVTPKRSNCRRTE